jgi:hypothetical protein
MECLTNTISQISWDITPIRTYLNSKSLRCYRDRYDVTDSSKVSVSFIFGCSDFTPQMAIESGTKVVKLFLYLLLYITLRRLGILSSFVA